MDVNTFLAALPALLAVGGFIIYQLIGHEKQGREITAKIIGKLRNDSPQNAALLEKLPPRQLAAKLRLDHALQKSVSRQDVELLTTVSQQEFLKSLVVYCLIALLFIVSVISYVYTENRPRPLALLDWHLESNVDAATGLAVDLDDLILRWTANGPPDDLIIQLENIQSGRRTPELKANSQEQKLLFAAGIYRDLLASRERNSSNRVRAIARGIAETFVSEPFELNVGIKLLVIPVAEDSAVWVSALIDNSAIQGYQFDADLVVWPRKGVKPASFHGPMQNPKAVFAVRDFTKLDWRSAKLAYLGPDNPRIVRTEIVYPQIGSTDSDSTTAVTPVHGDIASVQHEALTRKETLPAAVSLTTIGGSLIASEQEGKALFKYTSDKNRSTYLGHFAGDGSTGSGQATSINLTDDNGSTLMVDIQKINSLMMTISRSNNGPCYGEKAVVTLTGGAVLEGCFRPYKVTFVADAGVTLDLNSATGTFVRQKD
jgi:hypothetical protein